VSRITIRRPVLRYPVDILQCRTGNILVKDLWRGVEWEFGFRRKRESRVALVAISRGSLIDRAAPVARLQVHLRTTVIAETGTGRIEVIAEKTLQRGWRRHLK
jgi:hypothetical protein